MFSTCMHFQGKIKHVKVHGCPMGIMEASFSCWKHKPLAPFCYLMIENHHKGCCSLFYIFHSHYYNGKQVDILIFKNQVLQMLYLKHHVYKAS